MILSDNKKHAKSKLALISMIYTIYGAFSAPEKKEKYSVTGIFFPPWRSIRDSSPNKCRYNASDFHVLRCDSAISRKGFHSICGQLESSMDESSGTYMRFSSMRRAISSSIFCSFLFSCFFSTLSAFDFSFSNILISFVNSTSSLFNWPILSMMPSFS